MEAVILVIHLIVALSIIAIVLVQPSDAGGFMGSSGGTSNMMTQQRRTGDALTRATTILAGLFFLTSLALAIIAEKRGPDKSILDIAANQPPVAEKIISTAPTDEKTVEPAVKTEEPKKVKPTAPISE
ncbi:MAG: preprotein translocase subunit SecG [Alphaproteobacteria bacterium]|nr:preprotein translocase subunit SecG [Alphaproteobacteria bacterium]